MNERATANSLMGDLEDFLTSSATNVERMSDSLRSALNVATGLEEVVRAAIREGRSIAIAGTAGSGKTHLLQTVGGSAAFRVVEDLTPLPEREWKTLFTNGEKVIVAGNEGAFLQGMHRSYAGFAEVVTSLHEIQKGVDFRGSGPVVIDAAGFDPAGSHTIEKMLAIPLLAEYVSAKRGTLAKLAWGMLQDPEVLRRIGDLIELASAESDADGFTFRQLWQLVSDLVLGSEDDEAWFTRLFLGKSEVSKRLSQAFDTRTIPLPHVGNHLWHTDLEFLKGIYCEAALPALEYLLSRRPSNEDERLDQFADLRLLSLFALRESPADSLLRSGSNTWHAVRSGESAPLLQAINRYFAFDLLPLGDDIELWLQHDTERRTFKPNIQISLGSARAGDFELLYSQVVANRPEGVAPVRGGRRILLHGPSRAALSVTKDLVDGILKTRSHRIHDRKDVEYDWRLTTFFEQIARKASRPERLRIAEFDFQARTAKMLIWQIGSTIKKVTA
jgi:hypothetical protein